MEWGAGMVHTVFLNSTHAVKVDAAGKEDVLAADAAGNITVAAGDTLVFMGQNGKHIGVTELVFRAGDTPLRMHINDNTLYTYIVPAGAQQGLSGLWIYRLTLLDAGTFAYDALA